MPGKHRSFPPLPLPRNPAAACASTLLVGQFYDPQTDSLESVTV